ncbi:ORF6N domain-containing protein [bacterium]|nr:ORF6N domain-containing protein [bacterium]
MDKASNVKNELLPAHLQGRIYEIRGQMVMLDSDLAELYGVLTKNLNKAVARNAERFPEDFMFRLTEEESETLRFQTGTSKVEKPDDEALRSQIVTSKDSRGGRRYQPYAFTEQGVAMLSGVLRSERAVKVNIAIMRAFVEMRQWARNHVELARKLAALEQKCDAQYRSVMEAIELLLQRQESAGRIGFRKE